MPPDCIGQHRVLTTEMTSAAEPRDNFLIHMGEHDSHSIQMEIPGAGAGGDCSAST
jgi:hypothetical protein